MNVLFVHQNFPGQFVHLAPALAALGHRVVSLQIQDRGRLPGVQHVIYRPQALQKNQTHPLLSELEIKLLRAEGAWLAALQLKQQGFTPDLIIAHPAWGESLFLQDVWPKAKLGIYCEFYYQAYDLDLDFDPEFSALDVGGGVRMQMKNANTDLHMMRAHAGISPTQWQASIFPERFRDRISVIHDGIDTDIIAPNGSAKLTLKKGERAIELRRDDEVITFVNRNLEPYRGYHQFMRALPALLRKRPHAKVVIVGGDESGYGASPPANADGQLQTWRNIFLDEVQDDIDLSRVFFVGRLTRNQLTSLFQISTVHVYLTYPFVLSWSMLEAMSAGCAIVASDTAPVREVIEHGETGLLVDFFKPVALADQVVSLCEDASLRKKLSIQARTSAVERYDLNCKCLPQQISWVSALNDF